ncbi:MAG: PPOX class F420-dependent oxidoreductase [Actinomycetota bacterium]
MTERLTDADRVDLAAPNFAHLATIREDGTPQVSVVWLDTDGDHLRVNSARGRVKDRNIARDPRVAVSVHRQDDPYATISVDGVVEAAIEGPEADAHIDALSRAYTGKPWSGVEGQARVIYRIRPTRIVRHT